MNYWHIQMQPDDKLPKEVLLEVITTRNIIGLGEAWEDKNGEPVPDPTYFKRDMRIGDIVMVRETITPLALVEIVSDAFIEENADYNFDWFKLRRKVNVLDIYNNNSHKNLLETTLNKFDKNHIQAPGTLTLCQGKNATNIFIKKWYKQIMNDKLMDNIKISKQRQLEIKELWTTYKNQVSDTERKYIESEVDVLLNDWKLYKDKILNNSISLDDYTNRVHNATAVLPGGYLCNFLERTTKTVFGSSKPGTANNFGVKLNDDNHTFSIGKEDLNADRTKAENYFNNEIKSLLHKIVTSDAIHLKIQNVEESNYAAKQVLRKLSVLDNLYDFVFIYSDNTIDNLHNELIDLETFNNLGKNYEIRKVLNEVLDIADTPLENVLLSRFLWKYSNTQSIADINTPNVILYGPPGTGKTYAVKNSLDFLCQGDKSRYEFVQFHPSFTYEDFIEGIKPKGVTSNGNIKFELVDGIFKKFCSKAKADLSNNYYFIVDEINRANLSSVFGETLLCLEKDYRHDGVSDENLIKTQYSALIEDMIKDDPSNQGLAYHFVNGNAYFGVPKNVFFIGMMNDVDKSIDAFDLALRRRFKWLRKDCDYDVIENEVKFRNGDNFNNIVYYTKACIKLNEFISKELGMGKSYEFGHSFFMKISHISNTKTITRKNLNVLYTLHLRPTLKEYLRSMFAESDLDNKLEEALSIFQKPINK
ncbi:dynein-related subfamily AAA family protein [Nonlabens xylanidelens]|uniref:Dynein-related subfamily AAA family protein n=1 Tax=Nonlabens xylanidelens TaxID=191564 RepID=A0A2S6IF52_9FLAO|nr:AAA family ATPase [Nonlabens xylanidelens]PPK92780.1 dynein-related subfamily AAA family protein [Nonlabens xylanidelens]PQJ19825.1 restriction endonuclease [Nonlabens xylanidelens]